MKTIWYKSKYSEYFVYECMKKYFNENDLEKFPLLILLSFDANVKLEFDYKDLFTETKHKFFLILFFRYIIQTIGFEVKFFYKNI